MVTINGLQVHVEIDDESARELAEKIDEVTAENEDLRNLVATLWPKAIGRERFNFVERLLTVEKMRNLGIEV